MSIYRLPDAVSLAALQQKLKAKLPSKIHVNELRESTGTEAGVILKAKLLKTPSRTHQERATASNKLKVASDKDYWAKTLQKQFEDSHLPVPQLEYRFHPSRKWRFDCTWHYPHLIAVEIEGAIWTRGRHTRGKGFLADMEKYNEATRLGWRVFRFTPNQVKTRYALEYLKKVLS